METKLCQYCHFVLADNFYYCPNCGKKVKDTPLSKTLVTQLGIYALSILLPPLGLWPGIKYLRQKDKKLKIIGLTAILLTIISCIISFYAAWMLGNNLNKQINDAYKKYEYINY